MEEIKQEERFKNNHLNALAKIKKAISAAMMAGMLVPLAAKEMKNNTTYREPTRVERSAEQFSPEMQAVCDDARNLFEDIIASDLSQNFDSLNEENNLNAVIVKAEVKDYINRLDNLLQELSKIKCNYSYNMQQVSDILKSSVECGAIDHIGNGNLLRMIQAAVSDDKSVVSAEDYINARKQYEYYYIGDMSKTCVEYDSKNDEWPGLGVYAYKDIIRNNPVKLDSGMKYISKDVGHLRDMMPDTCGPAPVKEAWIWAILSTDTINEIVCELKKNGFFIVNYDSLQPDRIINQRQTDQEKGL